MKQEIQKVLDQYRDNISEVIQFLDQMENIAFSKTKLTIQFCKTSLFPDQPEKHFLFSNIRDIIDQLSVELKSLTDDLSKIMIPELNPDVEPMDATAEGDLLFYLINVIDKGITNKETLFSSAISILEVMCATKGELIHGDQFHVLYADHDRVRTLIEIAFYYKNQNEYEQAEDSIDSLTSTIKILHLFDPRNHINLYKQSFIQVMAYFDSCVFQLFQIALKHSLFEWLDYFDNKTLKTHDIAKYSSFDELKENLIETLLKSCYVKDLLEILRNKESLIFKTNGIDIFPIIREEINRRNVHIHSNGIADKQYIESYNIHSKSVGDYLEIDITYCHEVIDHTNNVIKAIADSIV